MQQLGNPPGMNRKPWWRGSIFPDYFLWRHCFDNIGTRTWGQ